MRKLPTKKLFTILILIALSLVVTQAAWGAEMNSIERALEVGKTAINEAFLGGATLDTSGGATGDPFVDGLFQVINSLLTLIGVIFFIVLIYGGYLWMFARGNEEQITKAKKITREVIIGIIIIVLARVFTEFILYQIGKSINI